MLITLKKIKAEELRELQEKCLYDYKTYQRITVTQDELDRVSEIITYNNKPLQVDFDIEKYKEIICSDMKNFEKKSQLCHCINNDFKEINGYYISFNTMFSKEMWTYLNLSYFKDMITELLFEDDDEHYESRIKRYFFNDAPKSKIDRTSFRFFWYFGYVLDNDKKLLDIAWEFIDPVKAVFERVIARNPSLLKAFIEGIRNNNYDSKFKSPKFKKLIPKNYNSFSAVTMLDALDYDELVNIVTELQKSLLTL